MGLRASDVERGATLLCGVLSAVLGLLHARWVGRNFKELYSLRDHVRGMVLMTMLFALANAGSAVANGASEQIFKDVTVMCKVAYCYFFASHTLALFKPSGWGGMEEGTHALAELIDEAGVADMVQQTGSDICVFWVCAGRSYRPNRQWLQACTRRIRCGVVVIMLNNFVARRLCEDYNVIGASAVQYNTVGASHAKLYLDWIELLATMTVASGLVPLQRFALKAMHPGAPGRDLNKFRMLVFLLFFVWIGAFQDMVVGTATVASHFWRDHKPAFLAVEMLLVQLMVHKAFVGPEFGWSPVRSDLPSTTRAGIVAMLSHTRFTQTAAELRVSFGVGSIQRANGLLHTSTADDSSIGSSQPLLQGHRAVPADRDPHRPHTARSADLGHQMGTPLVDESPPGR